MKKTFPVNINGKIFYIDEDAYRLLLDYLSQLRATFTGDEGAEIVNDIEQRISEHFDERISLGANVIVIDDVNNVIEIMGRPEEISDETENPDARCHSSDSGETSSEPSNDNTSHTGSQACPPPPPIHKRLYRDVRHKVFGGVIAGLAQYLGWDATVMRILAVIITCFTYFWPCIIIYLVAWMVIPVARTPREILEMQGQPVTLGNIGQTVINNATTPEVPVPGDNPSSFSSFINTFFSIAAKFILAFFGLVSSLMAFAMIAMICAIIAGICLWTMAGFHELLDGLNLIETSSPITEAWGYVCVFFAVLIPSLVITRYCCVPLFRAKTPSTASIITAIIFEMLFVIGAIILITISEQSHDILNIASDLSSSLTLLPVTVTLTPAIC